MLPPSDDGKSYKYVMAEIELQIWTSSLVHKSATVCTGKQLIAQEALKKSCLLWVKSADAKPRWNTLEDDLCAYYCAYAVHMAIFSRDRHPHN